MAASDPGTAMTDSAQFLNLSDADVQGLSMPTAIEINKQAFIKFATGGADVPEHTTISVPDHDGATLVKPAYIKQGGLGLKLVSVRPRNADKGLPTVPAVILLADEETGIPNAMVQATVLTVLRTAAGSGAATDALAAKDASNLVVFGAGKQARAHVDAVLAVRKITRVVIANRSLSGAQALATAVADKHGVAVAAVALEDKAGVQAAVREADVVCTTTNASSPLFDGTDLKSGVHINAIGSYRPTMQELDVETIKRGRTFCDVAPDEIFDTTGCYGVPLQSGAVTRDVIKGQIGAVLAGTIEGRTSAEDITIFKSVGCAVQDVATATAVVDMVKARK